MKPVYYLLLLAFLLPAATFAQNVYEIKFIAGTTQYRAALILWDNSNTGKMRVRYYADGQTNMVEETAQAENTLLGLRIAGYDAVYPGTGTRHPSYKPDNFYLSTDENGNVSVTNIDDGGVVANCSVRVIKGYYDKQDFLRDFNWKLD